ncbi:MAG: hypothetical protein IPI15_17980 [Saprospiraceae bacterium]|uniref:hypothetical protein n=1 Tax=Candidatus Brachybacter algidus TaxID=2982024 RepID=UPI00257F524C|nr:hypothetical protein [Candidatus Brachybacter algidus]MBK7605419.1 hypothetical protein [Candidatus Brachybacter algidus]
MGGSPEPEVVSKPKKYILKHRPVFQEVQLWLAKTYIQRQFWKTEAEYSVASNLMPVHLIL